MSWSSVISSPHHPEQVSPFQLHLINERGRIRPQKGDVLPMKEKAGRIMVIVVLTMIALFLLGTCPSNEGPPIDPRVVGQQIKLVNQSLESLQEEVAAARTPSRWQLVLFMMSILAPLGAGIWLLWRAEQAVIGHDQVTRAMVRVGLKEPVIRAYLSDRGPLLRLPSSESPASPLTPRRWRRGPRRRRRWRGTRNDV